MLGEGLVSGVHVEGAGAVVGGLGHEEPREEELEGKGAAHGVHAHPPGAVLDDGARCGHGKGLIIEEFRLYVCVCVFVDIILGRYSPMGDAKLMPPSTPKLKTADWKPRS